MKRLQSPCLEVLVREITDRRYRAQLLVEVALSLAGLQREMVVEEAIAAARGIQDTVGRAAALVEISSCLSQPLRDALVLEAVATLQTSRQEGEEFVRTLGDSDIEGELTDMAFSLARQGYYEEALIVARQIRDRISRMGVLGELMPHLSDKEHEVILQEIADSLAKGIENPQMLASVTLTQRGRFAQIKTSIGAEVVGLVRTRPGRRYTKILAEWAPWLARLPCSELYPLWREVLHSMVALPPPLCEPVRHDLFLGLQALLPVIDTLGGTEALMETFHAVQDVSRWWP